MKKRGQFYLISAIILIVLIIGFVTVANYSKKKGSAELYDLKKELQIESSKVLDYITINDDDRLDEFTKSFSEYAGQNIEIIYIIGSEGNIESYKYVDGNKELITVIEEGSIIKITIDDVEYEFELKPGENFYFVISQEIGEEQFIVTG